MTACGFQNFCARVAEIGEKIVQLLLDQCYLGYCPRNSRIARVFPEKQQFQIAVVIDICHRAPVFLRPTFNFLQYILLRIFKWQISSGTSWLQATPSIPPRKLRRWGPCTLTRCLSLMRLIRKVCPTSGSTSRPCFGLTQRHFR